MDRTAYGGSLVVDFPARRPPIPYPSDFLHLSLLGWLALIRQFYQYNSASPLRYYPGGHRGN